MRQILRILAVAALACLTVSCGEPEPPTPVTVAVSPSALSFTDEGGSGTLSVSSNGSWTVQVDGGWIQLSSYGGTGAGSVVVTASVNDGEARTATLTFKTQDASAAVSVSQSQHTVKTKSIREVRALYTGSDYRITEDIQVEGTVISDYRRSDYGGLNNYSSARTIVISDGDAGLQLYTPSGDENKTFARGDKVRVSLLNQTLHVYNYGAMEVSGIPTANITKIGTETPAAREITIDQLLSGDYESTYVAVTEVQVKDAYVGSPFVRRGAEGEALNTSIPFEGRDGRDFDLFTSKYAVFGDVTVPSGSGTLKGIAGKYGARIQLSLSATDDCAGLTGDRFSTGAHFSLSFTEFPAWGDAGSFDVTLTSDVEWTASCDAGLTLTPDRGSGSEKITVRYTDNPSSSAVRTLKAVFRTASSQVSANELTLTVTQQPFEVLVPGTVQPWLELPAVTAQDNFAFFSHDMQFGGATVRNYSFWLDLENRVSRWVAYPLFKGMTSGVERTDKWGFDPLVPRRYQAETSSSYAGSGYDRGHQLPSADRLCTVEANEATFYYTNITPQNSDLNGGLWQELESHIRKQLSTADTLFVVTGCAVTTAADPEVRYIKDNAGKDVAIPKAYFKVILKYKAGTANGGYSAIGFWMENKAYGATPLSRAFARSVDEIEQLTDFDFFVNLKDEYEKEAESKYDASAWGL